MDAEQSRRRLARKLGGDDRTPVATLRDVARVAEALHQLGPDARDVLRTPTGGSWSARKAVTGNRRNHDIESVCGSASVRDRIGEWTDGPEEFEHRARPAVRDEHRHGVLFLRLDLNEMNVHAVDVRHELRQRIQRQLCLTPDVTAAPVL